LIDVLAFQAEAEERLAQLEGYEQRVSDLEQQRRAAETAEREAASVIVKARRAAADRLAAEVEAHLRRLAMAHASLAVTVGDDDPGDDVAFLLSANPGSPLLPLARVASGGELARTMLALRMVLTEAPDTLVFDEVDAGIGGAAAVAVGRSLADLGARHQVLVVTHLPQVAALADTQIVVSKRVAAGTTVASAEIVAGERRVLEVARMLSGDQASTSARRHAAELLLSGRRTGSS
jgi:DNA repair protein RecN (Recombination protein N)